MQVASHVQDSVLAFGAKLGTCELHKSSAYNILFTQNPEGKTDLTNGKAARYEEKRKKGVGLGLRLGLGLGTDLTNTIKKKKEK